MTTVGHATSSKVIDEPKSLNSLSEREARRRMLSQAHIAPLSLFVAEVRRERGTDYHIPDFDPMDGGTRAECLFLLEAPGPQAIASGFVSRNNPDETAKNFLELNQGVGLDRSRTIIWNVAPWYVGNGSKIRPVNARDLEQARPYLRKLIELLPRMRVVMLVGRKAERVEPLLQELAPTLRILKTPHPSPVFVNRRPENRAILQRKFQELVALLDGQ